MESENVYTKQQRIAQLAGRHPQLSFTSLAYHIDMEWLHEAYRQTRKDAAAGVDGTTAAEYEQRLEENLQALLERFKSGSYFAPPVRRVYIPKEGKAELRPLGIPTLGDKILQRAVVMLLTPLYEQDFLGCSYAFRPKRKVYDALDTLRQVIMEMGGCWVLEVDIKKYFESVKHEYVREFIARRVSDGVIRRVIGKWLNAGVWERGSVFYTEEGTPQGGVVSPLLSNIYLHEVLDTWFEREIRSLLSGRAELVRFADDFVILCKEESDARRLHAVLPKRFGKFGLTLHPEKTRIIDFRKPSEDRGEPESFTFLGFTHYWGKSQRGYWVVKKKTAKHKLKGAVRRVFNWCKENRDKPIKDQWQTLNRKVKGHYGFYGITHNFRSLQVFLHQAQRSWHYWLNRRSRRRDMSWDRFKLLLERWPLAQPRIVHSYLAKP